MKVLIIDDEGRARNLLRTIIDKYCSGITEIHEAEDLPSGVKLIYQEKPQIVFLDIEMPGYLGTQIVDFFEKDSIDFQMIFTTAYSEYAIKAFELNAIAYLLKPLDPQKVCSAIQKALSINNNQQFNRQLQGLKSALTNFKFGKIGLPVSDGILYVKLEDVLFLQAEGMYTRFHTFPEQNILTSKPLKHYMKILEGSNNFFRTHRSYLINIKHIKQFVKKDGIHLLMDNDAIVAVSKEKQTELLEILNADL